MKLSVIIPVHNGSSTLRQCLQGLAASTRPPDEVLIVDDASTDSSAEIASAFGTRVLSLPRGPNGPAVARNRGVEVAQGDIVVFLDADVVAHPDTLARIERRFKEHPEVAALFGSYDDAPPHRSVPSLYKNLLHHYVHQHGRREASTFWAGCGAVRREVYRAVGGFDESYARPSIEDIALGLKLRAAGHTVWLCPEIQVTHLKRWTLASVARTDICQRAVPWTQLIRRSRSLPNDLNLGLSSRLSALAAWLLLFCLLGSLWSVWAQVGLIVTLIALVALNADLFRFFFRRGGPLFALGAAALHTLYYLYSSLTFVVVTGLESASPRKG
jgi:glycosyltransferase involved in cell wall biosynthesis